MNESEARSLVHDLVAAFPPAGPETIEVYVRYLSELPDHETASQGVAALIRSVSSLPPIAAVRQAYRRADDGLETQPDVVQELSERLATMIHEEVKSLGASG